MTFTRLLLTGAAGALGQVLRPRLRGQTACLRLSDVAALTPAQANEELAPADLADAAAVDAMVAGCEAIVHLGGVSVEGPFEPILQANIVGTYHLYEAARRHGVRRIVYASSNHVTGFYRQNEVVDPSMPMRPDGHYGLSKAFGENLAQFYFDRYGLETVSLRIGSCFPEPRDRRMLATWLSHDDLERLVLAGLHAPVVAHSVIYGLSDNRVSWWDNGHARHLGYRPQDSAEAWRDEIESRQPAHDPADPASLHQGGAFVTRGPYEPPLRRPARDAS